MDVVVDGEHRRDNFYSFVTEKLDGTRLMSLAEMLDTVEDRAGFEEMLETLDVPASAIRNPTCVGPLARREPLAVEELRFVQQLTDRPVKVTLPGPYLLTRSMWVGAFTSAAYPDKTAMGEDVVRILREELARPGRGRRGVRPVRRAGPDRDRPLGGVREAHVHVSDPGHPP